MHMPGGLGVVLGWSWAGLGLFLVAFPPLSSVSGMQSLVQFPCHYTMILLSLGLMKLMPLWHQLHQLALFFSPLLPLLGWSWGGLGVVLEWS